MHLRANVIKTLFSSDKSNGPDEAQNFLSGLFASTSEFSIQQCLCAQVAYQLRQLNVSTFTAQCFTRISEGCMVK